MSDSDSPWSLTNRNIFNPFRTLDPSLGPPEHFLGYGSHGGDSMIESWVRAL